MADKKKTPVKKKKKDDAKTSKKSYDFDMALFASTKFEHRTAEISVPEMKDFYPAGVKPTLEVRGLTGEEISVAEFEVAINQQANREFSDSSVGEEIIKAIKTLTRISGGESTPDNHVKMLNFVRMGLVNPKLSQELVIKFATVYPVEFRMAYMKITELTGRGQATAGK